MAVQDVDGQLARDEARDGRDVRVCGFSSHHGDGRVNGVVGGRVEEQERSGKGGGECLKIIKACLLLAFVS
jgi:hypothetical protein